MNTMDQSVGAGVYASRIGRVVNSGFTAVMISIGHRTGLFDVMAALPPSTSEQIARAAGLAERYVREWLAALASAHIVHFDARTSTYVLPIEYAAVLSRRAGTNNLAPAAQMLSLLASVEDMVVAAFQSGGGVLPEAYDRFHQLVSSEKRLTIDASYVDALVDLVPALRLHLDLGASVLDAGCGDGALLTRMARMFPRSRFRGYDISAPATERARENAAEADLRNVDFQVRDVRELDEPHAYDLILAVESVHEMGFPRVALRRIARALKRDGVFVMQELAASSHLAPNIEHPFAPMLYALSCLHSVPVALSQDGEALGRMWGSERAEKLLSEAGFRNIRFATLGGEAVSDYVIANGSG
ncbi:MAG: class I SAM-dependent methyltransferase [Acidobacteriota bacterium]|nr:class I SAM-dependent methyltransferase [Acidobacteriota bacterium]